MLRRFGLLGLTDGRPSGLLRVQAPQVRQPLECRIALHALESLQSVVLVAALELRDAEREPGICLVLYPALAQSLRELVGGFVVLTVTKVRAADREVLDTSCGGIGLLL